MNPVLAPQGQHPLVHADMPPGSLGRIRGLSPGPLQGAYQPIEIHAPAGVEVTAAVPGGFPPPVAQPMRLAVLVGGVYRFQLTNLPMQPGTELFPTVEVIDRLYPPPGQEGNFPIPIHFDALDIRDALAGRLVTRVVYLEDPQTAFAAADPPQSQRTLDVRPDTDPLLTADRLGRPVAVIRLGSRVPPDQPELLDGFLMGSPPWIPLVSAGTTMLPPGTP